MNFINIFSLSRAHAGIRSRHLRDGHSFSASLSSSLFFSLRSLCADLREIEVPRTFLPGFFAPSSFFSDRSTRGIRDLIGAKCRKDILREYLKLSSRAREDIQGKRERKRGKKGESFSDERRRDSSSRFAKIPKRTPRNCFITCWCLWDEREDEN